MFTDLNILRTFMVIVKERSFSRASKALKISQPAVTLQMKKLEEIVGTTLIIRKKNGILLTREGEKFKELCDNLMLKLQYFSEEIKNIKSSKSRMIIATVPVIQEIFLPKILDKISDTFDVNVDIRVKNPDEINRYLDEKRCDIALTTNKCFSKDVISVKYREYKFVLVSNQKVEKRLTKKDLYELDFIKDSSKPLNSIFNEHGMRFDDLKSTYTLNSTMAALSTITYNKTNQYFAFLPDFMLEEIEEAGLLHRVEVEDLELKRAFYISAPKESEDKLNKFLEIKA